MSEPVGEYPKPCELCGQMIGTRIDLDWPGLGECVGICARCVGSGIEPDRDAVKESYDQHAVGIIKNLAMLVRRLAHKHPDEKLAKQAHEYLWGEGLQGSLLRASGDAGAKEPK